MSKPQQRDSNRGSSVIEADAMTTMQSRKRMRDIYLKTNWTGIAGS
jgi:hypothetical protein